MLLLLWPLAVFGGRSAGAAIAFGFGSVLLAMCLRPAVLARDGSRHLDRIILFTAFAIALQATPLPATVVSAVSPHAVTVRQALALLPATSTWTTLSIDERATLWADVIVLGAIAMFFSARTVVTSGGLRQTVRGITALGFVFSALALAQAATAGRFIYWRFPTEYEGPLPFGPFVNRNHFATWIIMAAPLCFGYMMARVSGREEAAVQFVSRRARVTRMPDGRTIWLAAAGAMMLAALLASLSRSGIVAFAGASALFAVAHRRQPTIRRASWGAAVLVVIVGFAFTRADIPALAARFGQSGTGVRDRMQIWSDALPVTKDFWFMGTGAGTFRTAMLYYQRADRNVQFNQAHNHYLQVGAEGGIVLVSLVAATLAALAQRIRVQLAAEISAAYWIRAGAACGLLAVGLQAVWETGLVMPANAALAAVLAAIATHDHTVPSC